MIIKVHLNNLNYEQRVEYSLIANIKKKLKYKGKWHAKE